MRAVNLIPRDLRGGGAQSGRSGISVYALLGALGLAVVLVTLWALAGKSVDDKKTELANATAETAQLQARASQLEPYIQFGELHANRVETVSTLSRSRFNWPYALREISRVLPEDVWLTSLLATVAPGITMQDGTNGVTGPLRTTRTTPAIEMSGCTTGQKKVAEYLAELRRVDGVTQVSIAKSQASDVTFGGDAGGDGSNAGGDRCSVGRKSKFDLVIFFEKSTATPSTGAATPTSTPVKPTNGAEAAK
jgi:Tfp pilus assembly protein PilN